MLIAVMMYRDLLTARINDDCDQERVSGEWLDIEELYREFGNPVG
jgi:hypothetical protein